MSPLEPPYEPKSEPPLQQRPSNRAQQTELHLPPGLSTKDRETVLGLVSDMSTDQAQALFDELTVAVQSGKVIKTTPVRWFRGLIRKCRAGDFSPTECAALIRRQREQRMTQRRETPINPPVNSAKAREQAAKLLAQLKGKGARQGTNIRRNPEMPPCSTQPTVSGSVPPSTPIQDI